MISLRLLGSIELIGEDGREVRPVLTQPKRVGLLAYMALAEPEGFLQRDTLLALFWPELGDEAARRALRQALHFLRQHLGQHAIESRGTDELSLSRAAFICDAWSFEGHLARGEDAAALAHYGGDLLTGFYVSGAAQEFDEWLDRRRSGFRRDSLLAARRASLAAEQARKPDEAERWARFAVDRDDVEESDLLQLLRLLHAAGDRAAALAAHDGYARLLEDRYETEPGPEIRGLVNRIRREAAAAGAAPPEVGESQATIPSAPAPLPVAAPVAGRPAKRRIAVLATLVALGLAATLVASRYLPVRTVHPPPTGRTTPIVAVAIFANRTADTTLAQLGTMAAAWISRGLSRAPEIQVLDLNAIYTRGRTSSGEPVDPMSLARLSRSTYVVGGEYYRMGPDSLRFAAEVLDGVTGRIVRSVDPVIGTVADPLPAIDELRNRMASAIESIVDPRAVILDAPGQPPPRYEAFREFVMGQDAFWGLEYESALVHTLRAARLDTSFAMASVFATVVAVNNSRCDLVDSITAALEGRISNISELERTTLGMSGVRCRRDWQTGIGFQRRRLALQPHSPIVRWTAASTYALANRPREAVAIYREIDPERELAWVPAPGRGSYYLCWADAYHQLGDFAAERRVAERLRATGESALIALFLSARSAMGLGDTAAIHAALAELPASEPTPGNPAALADDQLEYWIGAPGWVRTQLAAELAAHGYEAAARSLAEETAEQLLRDRSGATLSTTDRYALGRALLLAGRPSDAQSVFEELVARNPGSVRMRGMLGAVAAAAGDQRTAEEARRWLAARTGAIPPGLPRYYLAAIAANAGELSEALDLIEGLPYGSHPTEFIEFHVDPVLAPLRREVRFQRFLQPR